MRKRDEIERDGTRKDILVQEILLDIRELLIKAQKANKKKRIVPIGTCAKET